MQRVVVAQQVAGLRQHLLVRDVRVDGRLQWAVGPELGDEERDEGLGAGPSSRPNAASVEASMIAGCRWKAAACGAADGSRRSSASTYSGPWYWVPWQVMAAPWTIPSPRVRRYRSATSLSRTAFARSAVRSAGGGAGSATVTSRARAFSRQGAASAPSRSHRLATSTGRAPAVSRADRQAQFALVPLPGRHRLGEQHLAQREVLVLEPLGDQDPVNDVEERYPGQHADPVHPVVGHDEVGVRQPDATLDLCVSHGALLSASPVPARPGSRSSGDAAVLPAPNADR